MEERRPEKTGTDEREKSVKKPLEREHVIGKSVKRVDAFEKVTGRAKYTDDLCGRNAYVAKVMHSTIAHGYVKSIDTSEAEKIPGVVKIVTCLMCRSIIIRQQGIRGQRKKLIRMWRTGFFW